ncbi:hypothetical protein BF36_3902 [Bacillus thuringiensis]|nr:hypothetical protein BF36_3902 [Bacillus thuringiensis]
MVGALFIIWDKIIDLLFVRNYNGYKETVSDGSEKYFFSIIVTNTVTIKINYKTTKKCKNFK